MNITFLKNKKFLKRILLFAVVLPLVLIGGLLLYIQANQASIIQDEIAKLNKDYKGLVAVGKSKLSVFGNFPHISIKIDDVRIYETKEDKAPIIMDVEDIYVGFNLLDIVTGNFDIQSLLIEEGVFNIVIHENNTTNIQNALASTSDTEEGSANIHLKKIKLRNLDIHKLDEATNTDVETFIYEAKGGFKKKNEHINAHIDTEFELNVIKDNDTTFIKKKHFEVHTDLDFNETTGILEIKPSGIVMEHGDFELNGSVDTKNDVDLDLSIKGTKPNFDMFIAFAPSDLIPVLERYKNAGEIYFNASINGPANKGNVPLIDVQFGASKAFLENTAKAKRIDEMGFKGHFTNGAKRDISTMEFSLVDMTAKLDEGKFLGSVIVKNFEEPEVDMKVDANFDLDFMVQFLNLKNVDKTSGAVSLQMNFHDIIDIDNPQHALNQLNQAYFSELTIKDLSISSKDLPAPLKDLNVHMVMDGNGAKLNQFDMLMGKSDVSITGFVSDLPAIIHHTEKPIEAHLDITSKLIDIAELTKFSKQDSIGVDEQITDLRLGLSFKSIAKDLTEFEYLPKGEFLIDSLHAQLKHYPHELHDFHSDIFIDDKDLKIVDFTGHIDDSDFHLDGLVHDYGFWMKKQLKGDVDLDINLTSKQLRLEDVFSYKAENYVPKDYRHEKFENLTLHMKSSMHYKDSSLHSIDVDLDRLDTKMQLHPLQFKNFNGRVHYEDDHIVIEDFHGEIGKTNFTVDLNYYLGKDEAIKKRDNYLVLKANYIDLDKLNNFNLKETSSKESTASKGNDVKKHEEAFNLYELPFTDMKFNVSITHFIHHRIDLQNIVANLRTTPNHYVYIDTLSMNAAGGKINLSGYFNGSDAKNIYMKPDLVAENVDLDKLLFKFENFGQDHLVSENLEGKLSTRLKGTIRVYPDLVPDLNQSDIQMDVKVLNGKLKNYDPMLALSDYMGDKNLRNIRFDTLQNHLDVQKGKIIIPKMAIESTLGHIEISGTHDTDQQIDYYIRIPWKTVRKAAKHKLFGSKKDSVDVNQEDKIVEVDTSKKIRYLNLKVKGSVEDYKISLGKDKK
ncbi:AsmA-like C-terminal region-containing protein [Pseudofulvibacter geojedonensis]|uniref:AsmA-like C-terminal region-containing protein n=1 Tax=Pseudofulvibacter geojedonensis TaxID=1123758 RepID=A0ABW3HY67_9FLAO